MSIDITTSYVINSALYGKNNKYIDVSEIVNNYIINKNTLLPVNNDTFFTDPNLGTIKDLKLTIDNNLYTYNEGEVVIFDFTNYKFGSRGNVVNNVAMTRLSNSYLFNCISYGNDSVISYEDTNFSNTGSIYVYASTSVISGTECLIGTLQPLPNNEGTKRYAFGTIKLGPFNYIYIRNNSNVTNTNVICTLYSN